MPRAVPRKTKWAPKVWRWRWAALGGAVLIIIGGLLFMRSKLPLDSPASPTLQIGNRTYDLEVADTETAQDKGLGDRAGMSANHGMLFAFDQNNMHCFWMKDMEFPLDIIWASSNKQITAIESDLSPATYPQTYCHSGQYVIELNAGVAAHDSLRIGRRLNF